MCGILIRRGYNICITNPMQLVSKPSILSIHMDIFGMSFPPLFILSYTLLPKRIVYHAWLVSTVYNSFFNLLQYEIIIYIL